MHTLTLIESIAKLKENGIKFAEFEEAKNTKELENACKKLGFPLAIKLVSKTITHKTEAGGVKINISTLTEARKEFSELKKIKGFESVIVQKMLRGKEIIIGGKRDIQFGPTVLVGLGGIFVEIFQDASIGICPVPKKIAREMLEKLKSYPILKGYRGKKGVNLELLEDAIVKTSELMMNNPNIIELDINPLIATEEDIVAVDARIMVD